MGSCTTKPVSMTKSRVHLTTTRSKISAAPKESYEDPHIRAKIFIAKDSKAPVLNLRSNPLWAKRVSRFPEYPNRDTI